MTIELRYAGFDEYPRISRFLAAHWAADNIYVRERRLFDWTFGRSALWDRDGYSFALAEAGGEIVGILGAIPFEFNRLGAGARALWLANYMIAPEHRRKWTDKRLEKIDYSMSCFLLYLGVKKQYPKLKHHTLILSERYKALIKDIFDNKILADDFSMYLHAPTRTDPSMAPEGSESLYVLIPVPNLKADIDWSVQARPFADKVLEFLEQWGMPGLRENLEVERIYTPVDFERDLGAYYGNAFAIEPKLTQTAYLRPHNASEDVEGLYFVGAGTHPGAGVPGVLLSAETTEKCIVRDHPELATSERRVAVEYLEAV